MARRHAGAAWRSVNTPGDDFVRHVQPGAADLERVEQTARGEAYLVTPDDPQARVGGGPGNGITIRYWYPQRLPGTIVSCLDRDRPRDPLERLACQVLRGSHQLGRIDTARRHQPAADLERVERP